MRPATQRRNAPRWPQFQTARHGRTSHAPTKPKRSRRARRRAPRPRETARFQWACSAPRSRSREQTAYAPNRPQARAGCRLLETRSDRAAIAPGAPTPSRPARSRGHYTRADGRRVARPARIRVEGHSRLLESQLLFRRANRRARGQTACGGPAGLPDARARAGCLPSQWPNRALPEVDHEAVCRMPTDRAVRAAPPLRRRMTW